MLTFTPIAPADYPLLLDWLQREHVKAWWNDGDDTLEKVARHYGRQQPGKARLIIVEADQAGARPIGLIQYELYGESCAGIDMFIGEIDRAGRGAGTRALRAFIDMLIERHDPRRITIDPAPDNARAIRCYEKAGFAHYETIATPQGSQAYMMKIDRR